MMNIELASVTNQLTVNKVIHFYSTSDLPDSVYERILWINFEDHRLIIININKPNALPEERNINDLAFLYNQSLINILDYYHNMRYIIDEDNIPENSKQKRDSAWKLIKDLVNKEPEIYYTYKRGRLIGEVLKKNRVSKKSIYKYLRRYWQYGKIKNALLPNYDACGGKGIEKSQGLIKRGRNRKHDIDPKSGINITANDNKEFKKGIKDFYNTFEKYPLKYAYEKMLARQYIIGYVEEDGVLVPTLKPPSQLPTFEQFKYWCRKDIDIAEMITSREGEKVFELKHRAVLGESTHQAFGPGSRYQIDATIADVYLVNSLTRKSVIKRVTIYALLDVFARITAGIYVGLEGPSWIGAAMALANAGMDKVEYCKEFGITITKEQWPCEHMPELITADRGELEGEGPTNLINTLGVDVEILPPYRADWKGIIEYEFRRLNLAAILWLPGAVKKQYRERGEKDYRLGAALTLREFTTIILRCVLHYNNNHRMNWYNRNEFEIADKIQPIPINLWNWGMENRTGKLRKFSEDILKLNLMSSCEALVTYKGIKFGKYYYTCETAIKENWFIKARMNGSWKIAMSYDRRKMSYAYIRLDEGRSYEKCYLLESSYTYINAFYEEVQEYYNDDKNDQYNYQYEETQDKSKLNAHIDHIVQTGVNLTNENTSSISDRQKILQIKQATKEEKDLNRESEAFILSKEQPIESSSGIANCQSDDEYIAPAKYD